MNGVHRVTLGHEHSAETNINLLNFLDASNRERARLWLDPNGAGSLVFKDENGTENGIRRTEAREHRCGQRRAR